MKKLTLTVPELEQIEINGEVFTFKLTDIEIINKGIDIFAKADEIKNLAETKDIKKIQAAVNEMTGVIDEILGKGATKKISKGHPVSMNTTMEWLTAIVGAVSKKSDEKIEDKYE